MKQKVFFVIFKKLSAAKNCLRAVSASIIMMINLLGIPQAPRQVS